MLRCDNIAHSFVKSFHHSVIYNPPPILLNYCQTVVLNVLHSSHLGCSYSKKKKEKCSRILLIYFFLRSFCNGTFEKKEIITFATLYFTSNTISVKAITAT